MTQASSLITLSPDGTHRLDPSLLDAAGGFCWWYLDMVNERGDGLVLIWSFGLPFLPGYASSARRAAAPPARLRPSLNVALYRDHELDFYLLQEYEPDEAIWHDDRDHWSFGDSTMETWLDPRGHRHLRVELDCPVPGSSQRLQGSVTLQGHARHVEQPGAPLVNPEHDWSPLVGPSQGQVDLRLDDGPGYRFDARAYFDRNGGNKPQHELGMSHWIWGRIPFEDHERLYYVLWPKREGAGPAEPVVLGLTIDAQGKVERFDDLRLRLGPAQTSAYGMRSWEFVELHRDGELWLRAEHRHLLDTGPFYQRYFIEARRDGHSEVALGTAEICKPDRVDLDLHRPFVRMRVHKTKHPRENSLWIPLFTGPRRGRLRRLVGHFRDVFTSA